MVSQILPQRSTGSAKKKAGPVTMQRLEELGVDLVNAKARKKAAEEDIKRIQDQMRELAEKYEMPGRKDGAAASEFATVPSGEFRVTRPAPPEPTINPQLLLDAIRKYHDLDPGLAAQVFLEVVVIQKADIDVPAWNRAKSEELVKDSMLVESLNPERAAAKPTVDFKARG